MLPWLYIEGSNESMYVVGMSIAVGLHLFVLTYNA